MYPLAPLSHRAKWQVHVLGTTIIMPRQDISLLAEPLLKGRKIVVCFDRCTEWDSVIIQYVGEFFHASPVAAKIRL